MTAELRPVVFGEVLYDRFPDGRVVLGGAPFNVAWHLQAFGLAPLMITRVGDDADGERIRSAMEGWGMDTAGLQVDPDRPTGEVRVRFADGEPSYDIVADVAYDRISAGALPALDAPGLLYHGSLALRRPASAAALAALAGAVDGPRFVDVNLRDPWWDRDEVLGRLQGAGGLKLNEDELTALFPDQDASARLEAVRDLIDGPVVLTSGERGATLYRAGMDEPVNARPERADRVVDTVGAGDAFCSVFLAGMLRGWEPATTMGRAQAFASAVVGIRGATPQDSGFYAPFTAAWRSED